MGRRWTECVELGRAVRAGGRDERRVIEACDPCVEDNCVLFHMSPRREWLDMWSDGHGEQPLDAHLGPNRATDGWWGPIQDGQQAIEECPLKDRS